MQIIIIMDSFCRLLLLWI